MEREFISYPLQDHRMSDPRELHQGEPRPASAHRTPREIAEDEAGPIGYTSKGQHKNIRADQGPVRKLDEPPLNKALERRPA
jgi:hypothetical protein